MTKTKSAMFGGLAGIIVFATLLMLTIWSGNESFAKTVFLWLSFPASAFIDFLVDRDVLSVHAAIPAVFIIGLYYVLVCSILGILINMIIYWTKKAILTKTTEPAKPRLSIASMTAFVLAILSMLYGLYIIRQKPDSMGVLIEGVPKLTDMQIYLQAALVGSALIFMIIALLMIRSKHVALFGKKLAIAALLPVIIAVVATVYTAKPYLNSKDLCAQRMKMLGVHAHASHTLSGSRFQRARIRTWCDWVVGKHYDFSDKFKETGIFRCPGSDEGPCNFAINSNIRPDSADNVVLLFETAPGWNQNGGPELLDTDNHNGKGCNVLFKSGVVEFVKTEDLQSLHWE
ncbi:hypothetical protein STSP2_00923 [Anaerohalosphaera lusitana]|uniref:Uncharacterized protein n=1 Tax=Anaerohalosphaera lusitana TaxID=1936003 RepID=A0A1U9NJ65_9BACT|nr:cell envelope integrity protein CreD [Anaerohalosphaera lusitana]AQT67774.1 hypothetical protein STSP2_00923 [Anaerohalosphaera lusitana]